MNTEFGITHVGLQEEKQVTHTQTHNKNNTTRHTTRQEQHHKRLHEEPLPALNNDRRWRGDGAYHLEKASGDEWFRSKQHPLYRDTCVPSTAHPRR